MAILKATITVSISDVMWHEGGGPVCMTNNEGCMKKIRGGGKKC